MNKYYKPIQEIFKHDKLILHNCIKLYELFQKELIKDHVIRVSKRAVSIAEKNKIRPEEMELASYLHDISGIIDKNSYLEICEIEKIEVLKEEKEFPVLLHQKISKDIALKCFNINNCNILNSIECHTTLKVNATAFDKILFISDKLEWDQSNKPIYYDEINNCLNFSVDKAINIYLDHVINNQNNLLVLHPWLLSAYNEAVG